MGVSVQDADIGVAARGARARTRRLMLETAIELMQRGETPSVSDVAEAAEVSRATAYRYFPSQAELVHAVVDEALGPILGWTSDSSNAEERVAGLLSMSMPRILEFEATFKAALKLTLEQWAKGQAGTLGKEPPFKRGHRVELLQSAIAPLRGTLSRKQFQRLAKSLSLVYGLEVLTILKDLWGLEFAEVQDVAQWTARALIRAAVEEGTQAGTRTAGTGAGRGRRGSKNGISA
jgi:AcrR family transcriptional regulator